VTLAEVTRVVSSTNNYLVTGNSPQNIYVDLYAAKRQQQQIKSKSKTNADDKRAASLPLDSR